MNDDRNPEQRGVNFTAGALRSLNRRVTQLERDVRALTEVVHRRNGVNPTKEIPRHGTEHFPR